MSVSGRVACGCLLILSLFTLACRDDPPENEMQQAQGAIDAAAAAGAGEYAHDEFTAAKESLKRAHDAVGERDYRLALSSALDSREHAQTAAKQAADNKAAARVEIERAFTAADAALDDARAKLKAGEAAHLPVRTLVPARRTIADSEASVQKARADADRGDLRAATHALTETTAHLREISQTLEPPPAGSGRRRR
jgi:hypothetical protein